MVPVGVRAWRHQEETPLAKDVGFPARNTAKPSGRRRPAAITNVNLRVALPVLHGPLRPAPCRQAVRLRWFDPVIGELLDLDALTGGFNFQAAWTTGWHAGQALAR